MEFWIWLRSSFVCLDVEGALWMLKGLSIRTATLLKDDTMVINPVQVVAWNMRATFSRLLIAHNYRVAGLLKFSTKIENATNRGAYNQEKTLIK